MSPTQSQHFRVLRGALGLGKVDVKPVETFDAAPGVPHLRNPVDEPDAPLRRDEPRGHLLEPGRLVKLEAVHDREVRVSLDGRSSRVDRFSRSGDPIVWLLVSQPAHLEISVRDAFRVVSEGSLVVSLREAAPEGESAEQVGFCCRPLQSNAIAREREKDGDDHKSFHGFVSQKYAYIGPFIQ
ncbi:MAG TPA: hypothetical protein VHG72_10020 [Polyangia bacterium]|nr:hypothetical protein [Polyangia bacterium]